jgi:hypothetical protein
MYVCVCVYMYIYICVCVCMTHSKRSGSPSGDQASEGGASNLDPAGLCVYTCMCMYVCLYACSML